MLTTFPRFDQFEQARAALDGLGLRYRVISPDAGLGRVGVPAVVVDSDVRMALAGKLPKLVCSGWVDYRETAVERAASQPPTFEEDIFGQAAIVLLAACVADAERIRVIAHLSGDLTDVMPYVNAEMPQASYNMNGPNLTFMDRHRLITLYPHRVAVAKADEIVDAWRVLEMVRCRVNDVWARRATIQPSHERRVKPPALEIYRRLPGTNCRQCGEKTCMAFAFRLWNGRARLAECRPVFDGDYRHLKDVLLQVCSGLGPEAG